MSETTAPVPTEIKYHQQSRILEIRFEDGSRFDLPSEYLRVYSPSAEVRGHGPGQEVLQIGKEDVTITDIRPVGNYAVCPSFSDGHNSGIYTWELLYNLGVHQKELWGEYLRRLREAGHLVRPPV
ncbi:MAG: putative phosphoribosylformimino-5-aminoimidazole carboxamide ribotide isomerase [Proteobacteria bacterium]|nr:putative phosphoribosylformimino-5-aminoimidazole carboxamide ribotide isomerase [Pseudomonadota bacterium]